MDEVLCVLTRNFYGATGYLPVRQVSRLWRDTEPEHQDPRYPDGCTPPYPAAAAPSWLGTPWE